MNLRIYLKKNLPKPLHNMYVIEYPKHGRSNINMALLFCDTSEGCKMCVVSVRNVVFFVSIC